MTACMYYLFICLFTFIYLFIYYLFIYLFARPILTAPLCKVYFALTPDCVLLCYFDSNIEIRYIRRLFYTELFSLFFSKYVQSFFSI